MNDGQRLLPSEVHQQRLCIHPRHDGSLGADELVFVVAATAHNLAATVHEAEI